MSASVSVEKYVTTVQENDSMDDGDSAMDAAK
jgi:hypothetical protein